MGWGGVGWGCFEGGEGMRGGLGWVGGRGELGYMRI